MAIVAHAVVRIGRRTLTGRFHVILAAAAFVGLFAFQVPFPVVIVCAGLLGFLRAAAIRNGARQDTGASAEDGGKGTQATAIFYTPGGDPPESNGGGGQGGGIRVVPRHDRPAHQLGELPGGRYRRRPPGLDDGASDRKSQA